MRASTIPHTRLVLAAFALASLLLAACSGDAAPPTLERTALPTATATPEATAAGARAPAPDAAAAAEAREVAPRTPARPLAEVGQAAGGAMLVHWAQWSMATGGWSNLARPLEDSTAADIDGYEGLDLGYAPNVGVSPDGRLMAVTARSTGTLTVYALDRWEPLIEIELDIEPSAGLGGAWYPDWGLLWSGDSTRLVGARNHCPRPLNEGHCGADWERDLWEFDIDAGAAEPITAFDFAPQLLELSSDGSQLFAIGLDTDICCGIRPDGPAFLVRIDLATGRETDRLELDMLVGQPASQSSDRAVLGVFWPGLAISPDGSRLYLVDSLDDEVVVVDLEAMRIERRIDFGESRSRLSRLGTWLLGQVVQRAEAKGGRSYHRTAEVTPDGGYLVVSGTKTPGQPGDDDGWREPRPAGLVVIDLDSERVVLRDPDLDSFTLSPNGRWVLGSGSYCDEARFDDRGFGCLVAHGVKLFDLESLEVVAHLFDGTYARAAAVSPDSRYAYITSDGPGMEVVRNTGGQCGDECTLLSVLDLERGEVVAERMLPQGYGVQSLAP